MYKISLSHHNGLKRTLAYRKRSYLGRHPASQQHIDGSKTFCFLHGVKLHKHFVQCTAYAGFLLAVARFVSFTKVEVSDEGVVYKGLEDNAHETCLPHVVETSKACRSTGEEGGVADDELVLIGRDHVIVFAFLAC
jgi:hypothetical protein